MADDNKEEDIKQFQKGVESHRNHLNQLVDACNGQRKRIKVLEDRAKRYVPMILTLCDSGDIAAFEIQGMRVSDQPEQAQS